MEQKSRDDDQDGRPVVRAEFWCSTPLYLDEVCTIPAPIPVIIENGELPALFVARQQTTE